MCVLLVIGAWLGVRPQALSDEAVPSPAEYEPERQVFGAMTFQGNAAEDLLAAWAEVFASHHPSVRIEVAGNTGRSVRCILESGGVVNSWRSLENLAAINMADGWPCDPKAARVAMYAAVVYVQRDNPIRGLTLAQLRAIYSGDARAASGVRTWGQLGVGGEWATRRVRVYAPPSSSVAYGLFTERVLGSRRVAKHVQERGVRGVVPAVAEDLCAIGFTRADLGSTGVRAVPLAVAGNEFIVASRGSVCSGKYPLVRSLHLIHCHSSDAATQAVQEEFLRFVYSKDGQKIVQEGGYQPLTQRVAREEASKIGR